MIPRRVEDVDAAWLTAALGQVVPGITVRHAEIVDVLWGTATKVRICLEHDAVDAVPTDLCLKAGLGDHADVLAPTIEQFATAVLDLDSEEVRR
jgi:hypothetical protein